MNERIPLHVYAADAISRAGVISQLRARPEVWVTQDDDMAVAAVALVVAESIDVETLRVVRAFHRNGSARVVVVVTHLDDGGILKAVEAGASGLLRRAEATPERVVAAVSAAACGDGTLAPDLLGRLLTQMGQLGTQVLAPRGLGLTGLADREVEVLRLLAEGNDTAEVAQRLSYSERTVKNVIHDVTTRLQLRNRSHAVAYAVRRGLI